MYAHFFVQVESVTNALQFTLLSQKRVHSSWSGLHDVSNAMSILVSFKIDNMSFSSSADLSRSDIEVFCSIHVEASHFCVNSARVSHFDMRHRRRSHSYSIVILNSCASEVWSWEAIRYVWKWCLKLWTHAVVAPLFLWLLDSESRSADSCWLWSCDHGFVNAWSSLTCLNGFSSLIFCVITR